MKCRFWQTASMQFGLTSLKFAGLVFAISADNRWDKSL
jgi:hypothetical protein